jgi:hypothetical protein
MTARQIWKVVRPRHTVACKDATGRLKRIATAEAAAATRMARWQSFEAQAASRAITGKTTKNIWSSGIDLTKRAPAMVKAFQKLEADGVALTAQIESTSS